MTAGPPVQRFGDVILLQGIAVHDYRNAMKLYLRTLSSRDGIYPRGRLLETWRELNAAAEATSPIVSAETPEDEIEESLDPEEFLTASEAAVILKLTPRQVRNKVGDLGARRVGRFWLYPADAVGAMARLRAERRSA